MSGKINMDWSSINVTHSYPRDSVKVDGVIAQFERSEAGRQKDPSYEIERGFLDLAGNDNFVHKVYEFSVFPGIGPLFAEFTPKQIIVGTNIKRVKDDIEIFRSQRLVNA